MQQLKDLHYPTILSQRGGGGVTQNFSAIQDITL